MPNSMHRHSALSTSTPSPVHHEALERPFRVVVAGVGAERSVREVYGSIKEFFRNVFVHRHMVRHFRGFLNSHFPIPDFFVHGCTVCRADQWRNTEIQSFQG